jgi:hypothetical protein
MAKHKVIVSVPYKEVVNSDVIFEVFGDEEKIGELRISKGGLDYYSRDKKTPKTLSWEQFDRLMQD